MDISIIKFFSARALCRLVISGILIIMICIPNISWGRYKPYTDEKQIIAATERLYIYLYPLVVMEQYRLQFINVVDVDSEPFKAPMNSIYHSPNATTVSQHNYRNDYSMVLSEGWLDLSKEPLILSLPEISDRYFNVQLTDMWSNIFASIGERTTGANKMNILLVGPDWQSELPSHSGLPRDMIVIKSPTTYVHLLGRIQRYADEGYEYINALQSEIKLTPISKWDRVFLPAKGRVNPQINTILSPSAAVNNMSLSGFFNVALGLLVANPPHLIDQPTVSAMGRLGLSAGKPYSISRLASLKGTTSQKIVTDSIDKIRSYRSDVYNAAQWSKVYPEIGVWGNRYLQRAYTINTSNELSLFEDTLVYISLYDSAGELLSANNSYTIRFEKGGVPKSLAFWTLSVYDEAGKEVANAAGNNTLNNYKMYFNKADESVTLYLQNEKLNGRFSNNSLPVGGGYFNVVVRVYYPAKESYTWKPPKIQKVIKTN